VSPDIEVKFVLTGCEEVLAALSPVLVPEIVAAPVVSKFPPSLIVRAALTKSRVNVLPAVRAVEEVPAMVTSNC
jgi:hypothetical protein